MEADAAPVKPRKSRSKARKARLLALSDLDGRSAAYQHAQETRRAIIGDLGGEDRLSRLEVLQVEHAALDAAILRDLQARWLRGDDVSITDMVSLSNVFNRTAAALGTTRRPKDVIDINSYLQKGAPDDREG